MKKNYYQILGLNDGASLEEIKKAYKEYVKHYHPDMHGNSEFFKERFQDVQEAYERGFMDLNSLINSVVTVNRDPIRSLSAQPS